MDYRKQYKLDIFAFEGKNRGQICRTEYYRTFEEIYCRYYQLLGDYICWRPHLFVGCMPKVWQYSKEISNYILIEI